MPQVTDHNTAFEVQKAYPGDIADINKQLVKTYGKDLLGRPKFRVVFSDHSYEKRKGTFSEYYGSIFVRDYFGVKDMPKHYHIQGRWVLEEINYGYNPELVDSANGHYEPKWSDWGPTGQPNWKAVQYICRQILFGVRRTKADFEAEDAAAKQAGFEMFRAELENTAQAGSGEQIGYGKVLIHE